MSKRAVLFVLLTCAGCRAHDVELLFDGARTFSREERGAIQSVADSTALEVRRLLPATPRALVLHVRAGEQVIEETGETAETSLPNVVYWTVDARRSERVTAIVHRQLRGTLFHELQHLVRYATTGTPRTLLDEVVAEGLATVFERDAAGTPAPWGTYPPEAAAWLTELLALPPDAPRATWMFRHPDGRRWIGFKVGAYLVDRAMRASRRSMVSLGAAPTEEILRLAAAAQ